MTKAKMIKLLSFVCMLPFCAGGLLPGQTDNPKTTVEWSGKALDLMTGKPIPGIRLECHTSTESNPRIQTQEFETDENGHFSIQVPFGVHASINLYSTWFLPGGKFLVDPYWCYVQNNGILLEGQRAREDCKDLVLKVKLHPAIPLQGQVVDANGLSVANATVYGTHVRGIKTNADGYFTLEAVPANQDFNLFAITDAQKMAGITRVKAGSPTVKIVLSPTQNYKGEARTANGLPAAQLQFSVQAVVNNIGIGFNDEKIQTNSDGSFEAKNICPQVKYVIVWRANEVKYPEHYVQQIENPLYADGELAFDPEKISPGQPIKFQAPMFNYSVLGRVVNAQNQPIAGASVSALPEKDVVLSRWHPTRKNMQESDRDGRFTVEHLAWGKVHLRITAPGYQGQTVITPSNNTNFTVMLQAPGTEGGKIETTVLDEQDNPISKTTVRLTQRLPGMDQKTTTVQTVATDMEGKAGLAPQKSAEDVKNFVVFDAPGYCPAWREIASSEDANLLVRLKKEERPRRGRLVDENGKPMAHEYLCIPEWKKAGILSDIQCDAEGRFTVKRVAENESIKLDLEGSKYICNQQHPLFLYGDAGVEEEVELVMEYGSTIRGTVRLPGGSTAPGTWYLDTARTPVQWTGSGEVIAGYFEIANLPSSGLLRIDTRPGQENVVGRQWICSAPIELNLEPNKITETSITLTRGIPVSGKLVLPAGEIKADQYTLLAEMAQGEEKKYVVGRRFQLEIRGEDADKPWTLYLPEGDFEFYCATSENSRYISSGTKITVTKDKPLEEVKVNIKTEKL